MQKNLRSIIYAALFASVSAILSGPLSFNLFIGAGFSAKISLAVVPLIIGAIALGPAYGAAIGALSDLLSSLVLMPKGAYFPGFTLTMALAGLMYGLFYKGGAKLPIQTGRLSVSVVITQLVCSVLINSLWMVLVYGMPIEAVFIQRFVLQAIMCPVFIAVSQSLLKVYARHYRYA